MAYPRLKQQALDDAPPSPADNFRWRYYGLFYVATGAGFLHVPAADPERHLKALAVFGDGRSRRAVVRAVLPRHHAGEFAGARNSPKHAVALIEGIQDLGLCSRGFRRRQHPQRDGDADGGDRSAGNSGHREYAREWHYHILNDRSLTGLPRKFNVAFDGAGKIAVLEIPTISRFPPSR